MEEEEEDGKWWQELSPQEWVSRLGQNLKVHIKGSARQGQQQQQPLEGFLFSVDPELHHLMLLRFHHHHHKCQGQEGQKEEEEAVVVERVVALAHAVSSIEFGSERAPVAMDGTSLVWDLLSPAAASAPPPPAEMTQAPDSAAPAGEESLPFRMAVVLQLLEKAQIPHSSESGGVIAVMGGVASIDPPYNPDSCRSRNEIVLHRLRGILATLVPCSSA
jgi:hypothetical protein